MWPRLRAANMSRCVETSRVFRAMIPIRSLAINGELLSQLSQRGVSDKNGRKQDWQ